MTNSVNLDSYFPDVIVDPNGESVCDINAGLYNLFKQYNDYEHNFSEVERYLIREYEENYPDLVALYSAFGSQKYWWWFLLLNKLADGFEDLKTNHIYSINSPTQVNSFINASNNEMLF
jgi:hypothetical protein